MKRLFAVFALTPSTALAHAGDHRDEGLLHFLTQPDHAALIALGAAVLGGAVWKLWSRR